MDEPAHARAQFRAMTEGTKEDWAVIGARSIEFARDLPSRIVAHLRLLRGDSGGFAVDRLEHCLQTATRAQAAGEDEEYVVCALVHDVGDTLCPMNHADLAGAIVKPYVSEKNHFIVEKHGIFQGYYFFHHLGLDRDMRESFKGHPFFDDAARFCELYDQAAFDPSYRSTPLEVFVPMIERVFSKPRNSIYMRR